MKNIIYMFCGANMEELLSKYESIIDALFKAEEWRKEKGADTWEDIRSRGGIKAYNKYIKLIKEAEQLQRDLKKHRKAKI